MRKTLPALLMMVFCLVTTTAVRAEVRLPAVISSHMVVQQKSEVNLWGWCEPGEKIQVTAGWDTTIYRTEGSSGAKWNLRIKTPAAGGPFQITIKGSNTIVLEDVLVGEVWVCSGQSNMEMSLNWGIKRYDEEVARAANPNLRFFHVPRTTAEHPQEDLKAKWVVSSPEEMKKFSAVAYFFGNRLHQELNVPIGLVHASWGGTPAEAWTPESVLQQDGFLKEAAGKLKAAKGWPITPAAAYNAMIHPLTPFAVAGAIWYQGESNVGTAATYHDLFTSMIGAWRKAWGKEFPFYYVQIAPFAGYGKDNNSSALLREAQTQTLTYPHTGMVVTTDLVDDINDIHPHNKKDVGLRLANYALAETYHKTGIAYQSPVFKEMKTEKKGLRLYFDHAASGLMSKGGAPSEFYIAGEDKNFVPAQAKVEGNTVLVWSKTVKNPIAVRFGFTNSSMPNLFSKEGLPVTPFRTDNWTTLTVQANAAE